MKPIWESSEVFQAYARIDYCYLMLKEIHKEMNKPRAAIEAMIDEATGYMQEKTREYKKAAIEYMEEIIRSKKIIEADTAEDEKVLNGLKENTV